MRSGQRLKRSDWHGKLQGLVRMMLSRSAKPASRSHSLLVISTTVWPWLIGLSYSNPNLATAWRFSGWIKVWLGEPELAIEQLERAARLSLLDPFIFIVQNGIAAGHFFAGRSIREALAWAQKTVRLNPNYVVAIIMLAVSAALAGREQEMRKAIGRLQEGDPTSRMSNFKNWLPLRRLKNAAAFEKGLRLTGLTQ